MVFQPVVARLSRTTMPRQASAPELLLNSSVVRQGDPLVTLSSGPNDFLQKFGFLLEMPYQRRFLKDSGRIPPLHRRRSNVDASMATLPSPPGDLPPMDLFLGHLKLIEAVIAYCCRRSHFKREEAEDFGSHVKIKLLEDDCAILRQYQGKSSIKTYLTVVIRRLLLDYQDHIWGKWRPSAEAERLGPVAIRLERLLWREGYSFDEACEMLRTNEKVEMSVAEIEALRAKLPPRIGRHPVGDKVLEAEATPEPGPGERLEETEKEKIRRRVYMSLKKALDTLSHEDQLFMKMRQEYSVAEIARIWRVDQKPLYRRQDKIHKELRKALKRLGVRWQDLEEVLGSLKPEISDF
jgi:RNA polymerase sigma factor (sigma-70 family)